MKSRKQLIFDIRERLEPKLRDVFLKAVYDLQSTVREDLLEYALRNYDIEAAIRVLNISPNFFAPLAYAIREAYLDSGVLMTSTYPRIEDPFQGAQVVVRFNGLNPRAEAWLSSHSSELIQGITEDQRKSVRESLARSMAAGRGPKKAALDIVGRIDKVTGRRSGGILGLHSKQAEYVSGVREILESTNRETRSKYFRLKRRDHRYDERVRRAIQTGQPLDPDKLDTIVDRYADRMLLLRGENIAITEMNTALGAATWESMLQLAEDTNVPVDRISKAWRSAGDHKVRDTHVLLNGSMVPVHEPFVSVSGSRMMFPTDASMGAPPEERVGCRCWMEPILDFFSSFK